MFAPWRALVILAAALATVASMAVDASAALRIGSVEDPVDAAGQADIAAVGVRYDEAGAIELRVRFHAAIVEDRGDTADWAVTTATPSGGCGDTRQGLAGLLELASGETSLTYSEVSEDEDPVETEIPARQMLSADGRELTVTARAGTLAGRDFACSELFISGGDEVPSFGLTAPAAASPPSGPGAAEPANPPAAAIRLVRSRLSFVRRPRSVTAVLRAVVCAPPRTRFAAVVREARRRLPSGSFTSERRHRFRRRQRVRCQEHRFSWRFRAPPGARYQVRARVALLSVPAR